MTHTFLITSAAYVEPELVAEFGRLPPAFLPLGNRRLFVHQHAAIAAHASRVLLTIPEGFRPEDVDEQQLQALARQPQTQQGLRQRLSQPPQRCPQLQHGPRGCRLQR